MLGARASFKNMSVEALLELELGKEEKADGAAGDMNLRKQIRSVVMRYLELELKDDSSRNANGGIVVDFIYQCIDQRPQCFIEGDNDSDCDFLQWLLSSCCLIMSTNPHVNKELVNCLIKLFQLLFLKSRKLFQHLIAVLWRVIKDLILISLSVPDDVPVSLHTFHHSSVHVQNLVTALPNTGMLNLPSNMEVTTVLLSLLLLLCGIFVKIGPFSFELDWNHLISLCKHHSHHIRHATFELIAASLVNGISFSSHMLDSLCWLLFELLSHAACSDCLQLLVRCINPIFGTTEQEVLAPVHFFARLSSILLKITISGVYELNSNFFQESVGQLLYNCWLVGVLPVSHIRLLLQNIFGATSNLKPFFSLVDAALSSELLFLCRNSDVLKTQSAENAPPQKKKKDAPSSHSSQGLSDRHNSALLKSLFILSFSCKQKLFQALESKAMSVLTSLNWLRVLSFIFDLFAGCATKFMWALKTWIEKYDFAGTIERLEMVIAKFCATDMKEKALKLVYTCLVSIGFLLSQNEVFLPQRNQCLEILTLPWAKEGFYSHKSCSSLLTNEVVVQLMMTEFKSDMAVLALRGLPFVSDCDVLQKVIWNGMVSSDSSLKVELIRVLPLFMYEFESKEAISIINEILNDSGHEWTEPMLMQLSKQALCLCYIVTGVQISCSLQWMLTKDAYVIKDTDYQHLVDSNAINDEDVSSIYCKILNFMIMKGKHFSCLLISILETSIKNRRFVNQDALYPLLSLMDHEDIGVVSSFGQRSTLLFDLWGSYDGDISTHPLLRKLTVLASSGQTNRSKVAIDILGCLGRLKNNLVFWRCVILLLEMLLRGNIVLKAASHDEIKNLCKTQGIVSGKLPLPLKHQICEFLVEVLNEKPSAILNTEIKKNFCYEVSNVFGYKTTEEFLQSVHDPFIPLLVAEGSAHVLQCLSIIADKFNKTVGELLLANFHYIFSHLICKCSDERRTLSLQFVKGVVLDLDGVFRFRHNKILNQLLLQLCSSQRQVLAGISFLASVQQSPLPSSISLSSQVEIANHLEPNFLSILKFFDAKLEIACEHGNHDLGLLAISSLTSLISLMGNKYITKYRVNVMALLRLCQKFKNDEVCRKACEAWDCFIRSVSIPLLGPLLSEIVVVLTPWISRFPAIISKIFTFLIITNKEKLCPYFNEVYMMPEEPFLQEINTVLKENVMSHDMSSEFVFESHLKHSLKGINHQRADVRFHAVQSLLMYLKKHQPEIQEMIISSDMVNPIIADIVTSLVSNLKGADSNLRLKYGECLGLLGAIDPGRISLPNMITSKKTVYFEADDLSDDFALVLIDHLKKVFLASRDAQEQNCCAFAIQEVLSVLKCADANAGKTSHSDGSRIWQKLPENTQEIISPYLDSKYSPRYPKMENSGEFFKLSPLKKYRDWIQKWTVALIDRLGQSIAKKLFLPCTLIFKYNIQPAEFLLPHVLLAVLCQNDDSTIRKIQSEICHILQYCDNLDDIAETVCLCSQTVFSSLDHLQSWVYDKKKLHSTLKTKSAKPANESGFPKFCIVEGFLKNIPKDMLAKAAFQCHAYARALMYLQQFLKSSSPDVIQKNLKFLQEIFVGLNDVDGVSGAAAFRSSQPSMQEQILQYQSIGNYRDALFYYQKAIQEDPKIKYYEDSLRCMMCLGEFQLALTNVKGLLAEKPEWSNIFNSYRIEAAWKLGDWHCLEHSLKENLSCSNTWGSGLGKLLLAAKKKDKVMFQAQLLSVRNSIMGPLTAASLEVGSYQRGYEHIVKLHMLHEVEDIAFQVLFSNNSKVEDIFKSWKNRLLATEESFSAQEPILNLRRTLLSLISEKQKLTIMPIKKETGCLWLKSAAVARHSNFMQAAHSLLVHAADFCLPEFCLENAEWISIQGDPDQALLDLQKAIESWTISEDVPHATRAKAMLMVGKLMEKTDYDSQTILKQYKDVIVIDKENEEGHFCLGRYYDRLLTLVEKNPTHYADVLNFTIKHYGDALTCGNRFIYHCLPRALSLWLDYGINSGTTSKQEKASLQTHIDKITKLMDSLVDQLAPYQFLVAFSQIISRVCHHDNNIFATLEKIILMLLEHFPQHSLWLMIAVSKSSNSTRRSRCKAIITKAKQSFPQWRKLVEDICKLSRCLLDVCSFESETKRPFMKMNDVCRELVRLTKSDDFSCVMVPLQSSLTVTLPACQDAPSGHNPFPGVQPTIVSFEDRVDILPSMQKPKKVVILASDGKHYGMMCKPKDDLRKDCRLMEFNTVINKFLIRDPECRQRHLHVRTYAVIPLSEDSGLVEWVDNTAGFRPILQKTYQEKGMLISAMDVKKLLPKNGEKRNKILLKDIFVNQILPRHPPVLGEWFMKTFPDPTSWYSSCQSFARTSAVMSIVGYIVGLGDRHGENILIDHTNGDVVHVDFSYLFNKGLTLDIPEIVPFRLTHNMVDAMGITKYEGTFRICCEMTMKLMRQQKDPLMCVLKTLIHDPLVEWVVKTNKSQSSDKAVKIVSDIEERLQGKTGKTLPLSVKSHVLALIKEATDIENLCQMYIGWGAYL